MAQPDRAMMLALNHLYMWGRAPSLRCTSSANELTVDSAIEQAIGPWGYILDCAQSHLHQFAPTSA